MAAELVTLNVDVIVTVDTPPTQAAQQATSTIPIVIAVSADPVAARLVQSLGHPGGNTTGLSLLAPETDEKTLELLKETLPKAKRVAIIFDPKNKGMMLRLQGHDRPQRRVVVAQQCHHLFWLGALGKGARSAPLRSLGKDVINDHRGSQVRRRLAAGGEWIRTFSSAILIMLRRPAFLRRISARLSKELDGFQRTPRSSRPPVDSNSVTSGLAGFDPVLRAPLPQSRLLGLVREIVPPFEGAPPHQQLLISAVSTSSAEDVANFVVVVG